VAKITSLVVKLGAVVFIVALPKTYAINLQLLGGIWIIQTLPALLIGLYTRALNPWALLIGWAGGIAAGTGMAISLGFKGAIYPLHVLGWTVPCYAALSALVLNIVVSAGLSIAFNAIGRDAGEDETTAADYM